MSIGFPTGISQGTTHTIGQVTWEWNGYAWEVVVSTIAGLSGAPGATGNTGPTGVGISGTNLSNYELIITYTNGVTQNIGYIRGETGSPGVTGSPGTAGTAGTQGNTGNTGNTGVGISGATLVNYELIFTYTTGVTQNIGYIRGDTGAPGTNGTNGVTGNTGSTGISGPRGGILYTIHTSTSLVDPGIGFFRFNQSAANISGVTMMVIDYFSLGAISGTGWINTWDDGTSSNKGYLQIQNAFNNNHILILNVTSVTDMSPSTYYEVGVSYVSGTISGVATGTTFAIDFIRTGDKGLPGSTGNTGATGNTGVGISGATLVNYELIFTYTSGLTQNIGYIRGETGSPGTNGTNGATGNTGVGISGATLTNYELIFTYTNGTTQNIGNIRGATGADGQSSSGGAAGTKTYAIFTPMNNEPPATNYATIDTRNSITVLDFDPATQESAVFRSIMPEGASFSSLVAYIWAMGTTGITGDVVWGVQYEGMTARDLDSDNFSTGVTKAMTIAGVSGQPTGITISSTSFDGITIGNPYRVKVYRAATDSGDTLVGDAELFAVEIRGA